MCQQCSTEPKIISENTIIVQKYTHHSQIKFTHYCGNGHSWRNLQPNSENRYPEVWLGTQKVKKVPIAYRIGTRSLKWGPFLEQWKNNALAVTTAQDLSSFCWWAIEREWPGVVTASVTTESCCGLITMTFIAAFLPLAQLVNCQLSTVNCQLSSVNCKLLTDI